MNSTLKTQHTIEWQTLWALAKKHRRGIVVANIVAILATLASVPIPLLMPLLVDEVLLDQPGTTVAIVQQLTPEDWHTATGYILFLFFATVLLRIIAMILNVWQTREFTLIAKDLTFQLRERLLTHLHRISLREYETLGSGKVASHLVTDIETIDSFIGGSVSRLLVATLTVIGTAVVLLLIHWPLALFILFMNPMVIYFTTIMGKRVKTLKSKENQAFATFQQALTETLESIHQIRAANREQHYFSRLLENAQAVRDNASRFTWKSDAANRASFLLFLAGFDLFRAVAMLLVLFSDLSIGSMLAVFGYLWFMMGPVQEILNIQYTWYSANAALGRVNKLLSLEREAQYPHLKNPFTNRQTVGLSLDNIQFQYTEEKRILKNLSLTVNAGEKVAFVGASGGGKSTLAQILLGLYRPKQGQICFDDIPVEEIGFDVVREHVSCVLQHPALFNDSVRNNLTLGRTCTEQALWQALEIAQIKTTVEELPEQLDTIIGTQGIRLSGGQKQRLAIARMIIANPSIVILDEATSALDTTTEERLHDAMNAFLSNRTTLIIAHRLSAVKQADRVCVFENGEIIEQGNHQQLIAQQGLYAELYDKQ